MIFYLRKKIKEYEVMLGIRLRVDHAPTYPTSDMKPKPFDPLKVFQFN